MFRPAFLCVVLYLFKSTVTFTLADVKARECAIYPYDLDPEPIVSRNNEFIYPEPGDRVIYVDAGDAITVSCPGGNLSIGNSIVEATCVSGNEFRGNSRTINFATLSCSRNPFHTARYTGNTCENDGREIEIGFILDTNHFIQQLIVCFNQNTLTAYYSKELITKSIGSHESGVARPSFIQDSFYETIDVSVNTLYGRSYQRSTINSQLGLSANSTRYITDDVNYYYARGHLSPKGDFVSAPEQTATFHYVNAAPQWQIFNGNNWEAIESSVRDYADDNSIDLIAYTGLYGISTLPHAETGEDVELYFYVNEQTGEKSLPIPALYWKLVYEPIAGQAIVLLGVNNPYEENVEKYIICNDIWKQITWLSWITAPTNISEGYSYACDYNDFKAVVSFVPDLQVNSLLS